jgi:hypothetical protein
MRTRGAGVSSSPIHTASLALLCQHHAAAGLVRGPTHNPGSSFASCLLSPGPATRVRGRSEPRCSWRETLTLLHLRQAFLDSLDDRPSSSAEWRSPDPAKNCRKSAGWPWREPKPPKRSRRHTRLPCSSDQGECNVNWYRRGVSYGSVQHRAAPCPGIAGAPYGRGVPVVRRTR